MENNGFWRLTSEKLVWGDKAENFQEISGKFPGVSGKFLGNFQEFLGNFPDISGKCFRNFQDISLLVSSPPRFHPCVMLAMRYHPEYMFYIFRAGSPSVLV